MSLGKKSFSNSNRFHLAYFGKKKLGLGKESFSNSNRFHLALYGKQYCPNKGANFLQLFISLCIFGAAKLGKRKGRGRKVFTPKV